MGPTRTERCERSKRRGAETLLLVLPPERLCRLRIRRTESRPSVLKKSFTPAVRRGGTQASLEDSHAITEENTAW